jgi:hypothetical protein
MGLSWSRRQNLGRDLEAYVLLSDYTDLILTPVETFITWTFFLSWMQVHFGAVCTLKHPSFYMQE